MPLEAVAVDRYHMCVWRGSPSAPIQSSDTGLTGHLVQLHPILPVLFHKDPRPLKLQDPETLISNQLEVPMADKPVPFALVHPDCILQKWRVGGQADLARTGPTGSNAYGW